MVDFGGTALMALQRFGFDPRRLGTLCFTHLHGDHIGGFPYFYVDAFYSVHRPPRTEPLTVVGPVGVRERLLAYVDVAYGSLTSKERPFDVHWHELEPGGRLELDGFVVEGFPAAHMKPPEQPLCLRISAGGRAVAFSGDTQMCEGLHAAGDGADLLVAECTGVAPPSGKHCTWEDWRDALTTIQAERFLLTHLSDPVRARIPDLLAAAPPGVDLSFAEDGLALDV
jgi:ribonuclease BN (tRNA processing enzyme)